MGRPPASQAKRLSVRQSAGTETEAGEASCSVVERDDWRRETEADGVITTRLCVCLARDTPAWVSLQALQSQRWPDGGQIGKPDHSLYQRCGRERVAEGMDSGRRTLEDGATNGAIPFSDRGRKSEGLTVRSTRTVAVTACHLTLDLCLSAPNEQSSPLTRESRPWATPCQHSTTITPPEVLSVILERVARAEHTGSVERHGAMPGLPSSIDLDECIERLYKKQLLAESVIEAICAKAKELLMKESNVVHIAAPVTVVGDIHGQFFDMLEIFKIGGVCPNTNYLFLGDYVDRGLFSVETISLLVCLKLRYPHRVHLIRGNHESRGVTQSYGFYTECARKYGNANVWHYFTDMFDFLTLSVVINNQIFCVHGGLSPSIHSIDQIKIIDRFREIPHEGPMADLVWSDPDPERDEFSLSPRGAGYTFGGDVVKKFLQVNSMSHILRAHQLCQEGYQILYDDRLSTVWSAPNYCYRCGNLASVLEVSDAGERYFNIFDAAPENDAHRNEQQAQQQQGKDGQGPVVEYFL